jgi:hypothetical protein
MIVEKVKGKVRWERENDFRIEITVWLRLPATLGDSSIVSWNSLKGISRDLRTGS